METCRSKLIRVLTNLIQYTNPKINYKDPISYLSAQKKKMEEILNEIVINNELDLFDIKAISEINVEGLDTTTLICLLLDQTAAEEKLTTNELKTMAIRIKRLLIAIEYVIEKLKRNV